MGGFISVADAFREWVRMFKAPGTYPWPKRGRFALAVVGSFWLLLFLAVALIAVAVDAKDPSTASTTISITARVIGLMFILAILYTAALFGYWTRVGREEWLASGRVCRDCGHGHAPGPHMTQLAHATFRRALKDYREENKRKRSQTRTPAKVQDA